MSQFFVAAPQAWHKAWHVAMATHRQISSDQEEFIRFNAAALVGEAQIAEAAARIMKSL